MKIIVIGSGLAGLSAAAYLARSGQDVTVLEQYAQLGGVTASYQKDGFTWDLGQLNIEGAGPGEPLGKAFVELGIAERVPAVKTDRGYVFPDFELRKPEVYQGPRWRIDRLKQIFPQEAAGLDAYWALYRRFLRVMTLARQMESASGLRGWYAKARFYASLLPLLPKKDWNAQQLMDHFFKDDRLKSVFISILADFFTPPEKFIGLGVFALNHETFYDARIPALLETESYPVDEQQIYLYSIQGGMRTLVGALVEEIQNHGGSLRTGCAVKQILVENNRAGGVILANGEKLEAGQVIASGGAKEIFFDLVGKDRLPAEFASLVVEQPLMDSVFMLHLGVDFDPRPYIHGPITYYYGTYDIGAGLEEAQAGIYHEGEKGFVVHVPSLLFPEMAPPVPPAPPGLAGSSPLHAMTIYTVCPDRLRDGDWQSRKEEFADKLLAYAEQKIPGLQEHMHLYEILTPDDWRIRTYLGHHAFGGLAPVLGAKRIPHKTPIEGLWFVGAQSESGGGMNNVLPAALKTAKSVLRA
jgi:phytoene dehydrogenase-like protein